VVVTALVGCESTTSTVPGPWPAGTLNVCAVCWVPFQVSCAMNVGGRAALLGVCTVPWTMGRTWTLSEL
jgi:hypothetical protein